MAYNQMNNTNSAFKVPLVPLPQPSQSEILLFNDIMEEKTLALRNNLNEFLQVYSYRKFDIEFSNFLKHIRRMVQEGQRSGANVSRIANSSHQIPMYSRPSNLSCRPPTFSMINSTRNSTYRFPENNFQPIEPSNPFKPPDNVNLQPRVVLPRIDQSNLTYRESSTLSTTVIELSQRPNEIASTKNVQLPEPEERLQPTVPNSYSEVTMIENNPVSNSPYNELVNDDNNSIESLLDNIGFKILVGLPNNNEKNSNASNQPDTQLNIMKNVEKCLSTWSVNIKPINLQAKSSVIILSGTLLKNDKITVLEKNHDAGVLQARKENNLVRTNNGLYRLIGNVFSGSPNELYNVCLSINGIPRTWKNILNQLSVKEKSNRNAILNFSLDSPAGPNKATKTTVKHDKSIIKKGSSHTKSINATTEKNSSKRKHPEYDTAENNKNEKNKSREQIPPLLTSTPKRPRKQLTMFETPSQILKNRFHQNIRNKANTKSQSQILKTINDSINVTKKRQSQSKKPLSKFLKPGTPVNKLSSSSHNSIKSFTHTTETSTMNKSARQHKQNSTIKNSLNNSISSRLRSKVLETPIATMNVDSINKSKQTTSERFTLVSRTKSVNTKQNEDIGNCASLSNTVDDKQSKKYVTAQASVVAIEKTKNVKTISKDILKGKKIKKKFAKLSNKALAQVDLFDCLETSDYEDNHSNFNIMSSPGKISMVSRTDKSRSETPPMFSQNGCTTTTKSLVVSEPPTPLSKSGEAKALKRVKAPKITLKEELKNNRRNNNKQRVDCTEACQKINEMLEFGSTFDEDSN